jgi:quercetin 2,3-dioxygenase
MSSLDRARRRILLAAPATVLLGCSREDPSAPGANPLPSSSREVRARIDAQPTLEGAGVKLRRSLGSRALPLLDPFLLLDEIHSDRLEDYAPGFPTHPHRGFETVTYMLEGAMEHRDSLGNHGHLGPGSAQWMTAGHGIVHSEMPREEGSSFWGFQLWVNLPASLKMTRPRYQDIAPARIEELAMGDARVRLVAGSVGGRTGPVEGIRVAPLMLDLALPRGGRAEVPVPASHTAFAYGMAGVVQVGRTPTALASGQLAVLGAGRSVELASEQGGRLLLLSAEPIGEPVARRGPFVMNTEEELDQAVLDYRSGRLVGG